MENLMELELAEETKLLGVILSIATSSTTNPTRFDVGSKAGHCCGKPAANCLSYETGGKPDIYTSLLISGKKILKVGNEREVSNITTKFNYKIFFDPQYSMIRK
jgi:hypothetical protein